MDDQRVEMDTRKASLLLANGDSLEGLVFLSHYKKHDSAPETVGELINREAFMPLKAEKGTLLLNVEQVLAVKVARKGEIDESVEGLGIRHRVKVRMSDGKVVKGDFVVDLPAEACRVKDYLNLPDRFFRLYMDDGSILYLNRHFILNVRD